MESLHVVCPPGQLLSPSQGDAEVYCVRPTLKLSEQQQPAGSPLLQQLQECNEKTQQLLTLLSIHREQGIAAYTASLDRLFPEATSCIVQAMQAAAAAKQPLLTTSSQHSSSFCKLLERLHLLDALWKASNPGGAPAAHTAQSRRCEEFEAAAPAAPRQCPATPFISQLESKLQGITGLDSVLAALITHAQQVAAAGSKAISAMVTPAGGKQEVLETPCLSAQQEHHSSARALPLLIRLYFNTGSRAQTLAAGRPEPLPVKVLERSLAVLGAKPVVPGCADVPVCLTSGLQACAGLTELAAARKMKLPIELGKLDFKAAFKLDQSYTLHDKLLPLLQQHDELCDLLSQLALELRQATAVERDTDPKMMGTAEQLVAGSINFAATAKNSLLELDAWRLSTCGAGTDSAAPTPVQSTPQKCSAGMSAGSSEVDSSCDRFKLKDDDIVPFMDVLGAIKGLTSLLVDSSAWLQPLLQEHAVKQLNSFASGTLPALVKMYARNSRLQDILLAIHACLQGHSVEVSDDVDAAAVQSPCPAAVEPGDNVPECDAHTREHEGRPLAEGFEGLKGRWGPRKGAARTHAQQQPPPAAAAASAADSQSDAEGKVLAGDGTTGDQLTEVPEMSNDGVGAAVLAQVADAAAADVEAADLAAIAAAPLSPGSSVASVSHVEVTTEQALEPAGKNEVEDASPVGRPSSQGMGSAVAGADKDCSLPAVVDAELATYLTASGHTDGEPLQPGDVLAAPAVSQASSRKRTLKGLFKFKPNYPWKHKGASVQPQGGQLEDATPGNQPASCDTTTALPSLGQSEHVDHTEPEGCPLQGVQSSQAKLLETSSSQQQPPCSTFAWVDSETGTPLCKDRQPGSSAMPSAFNSAADLNGAGFERPPCLPWELTPADAHDSPHSVAEAAAMFERIAAVHRQAAAANERRLPGAATKSAAQGSKSSPGGWDSREPAALTTSRLSEVCGTPPTRQQLRAMAADQQTPLGSPEKVPVMGPEPSSAPSSPTHSAPARKPGLFGFRSLLPHRAAAVQQQQPQQLLRAPGSQDEATGSNRVEQDESDLAEQLHTAQVADEPLELQGADGQDDCTPAAGQTSPGSPKDSSKEGKQRMKSMLSMLRRNTARSACAGAAAALQATGTPASTTTAVVAAAVVPQEDMTELAAAEGGMITPCTRAPSIRDKHTAGSPCDSQPDASEDFDEDQPAKTRRVMGLMSRIRVFTQGAKEQQAAQPVMQQLPQHIADGTGGRSQGLKGLKYTAKIKKTAGDMRGSRFGDALTGDALGQLTLEVMPSAASLQLLRVLLELLLQEIKQETKKHLMMQLQLAAAAAAGSAGVAKPDASIARPLKLVKHMIKAVHSMQLMVDFPAQLLLAADLSDLWVGAPCGAALAAIAESSRQPGTGALRASADMTRASIEALRVASSAAASPSSQKSLHPWPLYQLLFEENSESMLGGSVRDSFGSLSASKGQDNAVDPPIQSSTAPAHIDDSCSFKAAKDEGRADGMPRTLGMGSFPSALIAGCMHQLERMPAELPLLALQVLWDARHLLKGVGLLQPGLKMLQQQEKTCMSCYMQHLVPMAYGHFKRLAGHQTVTTELLHSCKASPLQPLSQLYLDNLLREPCCVMMQGSFSAVTAHNVSVLKSGHLAALDMQLAAAAQELADLQHELQQQKSIDQLQRAVQQQQQQTIDSAQPAVSLQENVDEVLESGVESDQQVVDELRASDGSIPTQEADSTAVIPLSITGAKPAGLRRSGRRKRHGRTSKPNSAAWGSFTAPGHTGAPASRSQSEQSAGVTPLVQKLELMGATRATHEAAGRVKTRRCLQAWGACELDIRQWLLAGMLELLQRDAATVVARCSVTRLTHVVESQLHAAILQRTHVLLAQYSPLPLSWEQIWQEADTLQPADSQQQASSSATTTALVSGMLHLLDTGVYDGEAQVLLPALYPAADGSHADVPGVDGVLAECEAVLQPLTAFFGRQHLAALTTFTGQSGVQQLMNGVLGRLEQQQSLLLAHLTSLQHQLPPSLQQLPPAEQCCSAGAVLQFYKKQLCNALADHSTCSAAFVSLQRMGNCIALLYLLSVQHAVQATPAFMQVAPLLGVVARPMTDAAAAAECFEGTRLPAPPAAVASAAAMASGCHDLAKACTAGLIMPEIEALLPSDHARHASEMQALKELHQDEVCCWEARQAGLACEPLLLRPGCNLARHRVWQPSHFQRMLLGADADKVRGPAMLLTQTAELRAWRATEGMDLLGPCLHQLQACALQLQKKLQSQGSKQRRSAQTSTQPRAAVAEQRALGGRQQPASSCHVLLQPHLQQQSCHQLGGSSSQPVAAPTASGALLTATGVRAPSAALSIDSNVQSVDRTTEGDLTEVEHQLQALQAQVNAALIAAEERLRVVNASPPRALLGDLRPRMQLPPNPLPFSLAEEVECSGENPQLALNSLGDASHSHSDTLEAEQSVQLASPRAGALDVSATALALNDSLDFSQSTSSTDASSAVPDLLTAEQLQAAAAAYAAASTGSPRNLWEGADTECPQYLPESDPPSQPELAFQLQDQSTASTLQGADLGTASDVASNTFPAHMVLRSAQIRQGEPNTCSRSHSSIFELLSEESAPAPVNNTSDDVNLVTDCTVAEDVQASVQSSCIDSLAGSPRAKGVSVSCPGRCEAADDDLSECDTDRQLVVSPTSPRCQHGCRLASPRCSPRSPNQRSPLLLQEPTDGGRWVDGSAHVADGDGSPTRYTTPPITDLLYETTCDELVRVKDERDLLKSEVEVLRSQLRNRDNTLAMLSGQMLITPCPSAADCDSLMRADEGSAGSLTVRSHPTVQFASSLPSNRASLANSANSMQAICRAASMTAALGGGSLEAATGSTSHGLSAVKASLMARQHSSGSRSAVRPGDGCAASVPPSERLDTKPETCKGSVHEHQTLSGDAARTAGFSDSLAGVGSSSRHPHNSSGIEHDDSCTHSESNGGSSDEGLLPVDGASDDCASENCCGASRKLKLPCTIKPEQQGNNYPSTQLAVALSALKFVLLYTMASGQDGEQVGLPARAQGSGAAGQAPASPLQRLKRAMEGVATPAALHQQGLTAGTPPAQQDTSSRGSGCMTTRQYGDGPLLASAVLLQLTGQSRRFEVLDASQRIAFWVEYDAVKASSSSEGSVTSAAEAASFSGGPLSPQGSAAASHTASLGGSAMVGAAGGIGPAAEGIAPPKPRSKKRQEEEAEALARERAALAAQAQLLERIAAAHRQALRICHDGSSLAARFAPAAPSHSQKVKLKVYRVDPAAMQRAAAAVDSSSSPRRITLGNGMAASATNAAPHHACSPSKCSDATKVQCVPVKATSMQFSPHRPPWFRVRPTQRPIQTHSALPTPRPQPLLLTALPRDTAVRATGAAEAALMSAGAAGLPPEAAAAIAAAAAAGTGILGPSGRLLTGCSVAPRAGLVAAARVATAREVLLQSVPRNTAYSFSVVSDHNRSGHPEDGYSKAPSSADLDSIGSESPKRSPRRHQLLHAAVGPNAVRLTGRQRTPCEAAGVMEQWLATGDCMAAGTQHKSPPRSPNRHPA